jgi:hypothetical protein
LLFAGELASDSLTMSLGIVLIASFLGLRQWYERRARESNLSDLDRRYLHRQDMRRSAGVAVMLLLAAGISIGGRIEPRINGRANVVYLEVWLAVIALLVFMVILAGLDWLATSRYARRQRRFIAEERMKLLHEVIRESAANDAELGDDLTDEDST